MANVRKGNLTAPREWWKHLDWMKRVFWKRERQAHKAELRKPVACEPGNPCAWCRSQWRIGGHD